jgi:hypothetical protein
VAEEATLNPEGTPQGSGNLRRRHPFLFWILFTLLLLTIAATVAIEIVLYRAEPILKARIVDTLSTRFRSRVELDRFHISALKGMEVQGEGLRLYPVLLNSSSPLFSVDHFYFRTSWQNLLHAPMRVGHVSVKGLSIHLPPKEQRKNVPTISGKHGEIRIFVDEIDCDNTSLVLETNKPGKVPLDFEIGALHLSSVGPGQPMDFDATLINPKPIGDIHSVGQFGPWNADDPGSSLVRGKYSFSNANLGSIKGIGGILSSTGVYAGTLDNIVVDGQTDTPDFRVKTGQAVPLHTTFRAIVDGTNGDTYLQPVDATLLHSHILAQGKVVRIPGVKGHHIVLDVVVDHARIDDLLRVGVKTNPPIMTGGVHLKTKFDLPPGEKDVSDRLQLQGNFGVSDAHFTNDKVQAKVDELSMRSQGKPQEAKDNIPDNVKSDMQGNFTLTNGKLTITDLKYDVPGANINMQGTYSLDGNEFDFHGRARLQATVSQMVGGWKGALLKPFDPLFKKNGAGTDVPIKVTGTKSEPHFGLDFGHKDTQSSSPALKDKTKDNAPVTAPQ